MHIYISICKKKYTIQKLGFPLYYKVFNIIAADKHRYVWYIVGAFSGYKTLKLSTSI